jgi:hypothetical protein
VTQIVVQLTNVDTPLPAGIAFAAIALVVVDNSGATLPAVTLNGTETPPWSATLTGASGPNEVTATFQALDTSGNNLGTPLVATETGTGGQPPGTFPQPTSATITVTG